VSINAVKTKDYNRSRVLNVIRKVTKLSRNEIADDIGLSAPAVGNLVAELIRDGLVREVGRRSPQRGQPPIELELCAEGAYAIGLFLERNMIEGVLVNLVGDVLEQKQILLDQAPTPQEALGHLQGLVKDLYLPHYEQRFLGVGLATFGPLDIEAGTINAPQFSDPWIAVPLRDQLAKAINLTVYLDNDATAAAIGEYWYGAGRNYLNFLYIHICEGLGGGLFLNGHVYRGSSLNAAEFGHMLLEHEGSVHYLEDIVSLQRFTQDLKGRYGKNSVIAVEKAFIKKESTLLTRLDEAATALAKAIVSVDHLLDLDAIILGGQLSNKVLRHLLSETQKRCEPFYMRGKPRRGQLVLGQTGEHSAALGAATLPLYDTFVEVARLHLEPASSSSQGGEVRL
jgi:predicted NBD/HSP70 family sugar kinase